MKLEILSPDELIFEGEVDAVQLPGKTGSFGILNNHAPIIASLVEGQVKVTQNGTDQHFNIDGGVVEVVNNKVIVLSD
ncbi:MAG: ATP synthase F1 subunit epsilon [Flavobacteriales bacterium]|jgi:F-type H+-transporting ATPase subunit epsilon|nr:ATP synthase F1 subunit epsilon [Flavobacteriales bacterium]MBT3964608.1 ATP synthase F1 subunit epsilon [Flavobacteriales bacterium]MBT4704853.1 ATP synthase F1 subunit epsilon [Flavobacteriales bacterium]MBT4929628.1 ATP synthase F1 subunit epsilon [Flavobacteriales bacterium]MBT5132930.1 ATP synthase F1 subunit epsilon [Flavobacteriales bacterium]